MSGETRSENFADLSRELAELPGEIKEEAPEMVKPEDLAMEELSEAQEKEIIEQRNEVEKTAEAAAELFAAMISEAESPEEIKKIMSRVDRVSALVRAETLEELPENILEPLKALGGKKKGANSSYVLKLAEKIVPGIGEGEAEKVYVRETIYKPKEGASGGVEYIKKLWADPDGRKMLLSRGINLEGGEKVEDLFPGIEKKSLRPGIDKDSLHLREWLAGMADSAAGTDVVPATVLRMEKYGAGSVQEFVPDAVSALEDDDRKMKEEVTKKMAALDYLLGAMDRYPNYLIDKKGNGYAIDNSYILSSGLETYDEQGQKAVLGELDIVSEPLEQFNPSLAGGDALDPSLPDSLEKSLGKFLKSEKLQGALKKCFEIALGPQAEKEWQGFVGRAEKLYSQKRLPTEHNAKEGRDKISNAYGVEIGGLAQKAQAERAAA